MSTFKGIVAEFPQIRIDYFRHQPGHKAPLAVFLSHVHSDHLTGLDSLRAPFVYCSAATREILLRLERYYHRVNFARGILESHNVTYHKSMRKLAKPLPLNTPTVIELSPANKIRVTLFDANHCVGAVMFLIEGNGKAVLYTGDIRAESWWVNSLVQNPVLLPYTLDTRRLDCIYLDTTFATNAKPYREFTSKANGIRELLEKVVQYPSDTVFYFHSWTFGYENVWIALSSVLQSQIHLDPYRYGLYSSLSTIKNSDLREANLGFDAQEASALCGFRNGNHVQEGCLTPRSNVRIHSCERGMGCPVVDKDTDATVVHIIPIITRANGADIVELGAGGGKGDLDQKEELDIGNSADMKKLVDLCTTEINDDKLRSRVLMLLRQSVNDGSGKIELASDIPKESQDSEAALSLQTLVSMLSSHVERTSGTAGEQNRTIRFPYSRHSSHSELCALIDAFKPRDVFPCTVDEHSWNPSLGMRNLFGTFCSANVFRHDNEMTEAYEAQKVNKRRCSRQTTPLGCQTGEERSSISEMALKRSRVRGATVPALNCCATPPPDPSEHVVHGPVAATPKPLLQAELDVDTSPTHMPTKSYDTPLASLPAPTAPSTGRTRSHVQKPNKPRQRSLNLTNREIAYKAALGIELTWEDFGGLVCTKRREDMEETEL